jgi:hypothetical protein
MGEERILFNSLFFISCLSTWFLSYRNESCFGRYNSTWCRRNAFYSSEEDWVSVTYLTVSMATRLRINTIMLTKPYSCTCHRNITSQRQNESRFSYETTILCVCACVCVCVCVCVHELLHIVVGQPNIVLVDFMQKIRAIDMQCTYNVILRWIRETIVVVEKLY